MGERPSACCVSQYQHVAGSAATSTVKKHDRKWQGVKDVRVVIGNLNPVLRGWGNYFRTGNAAQKFRAVDRHVCDRLRQFMLGRFGRHLRPGQAAVWTREWFEGHGLHRLRGTIRYPNPCTLHT